MWNVLHSIFSYKYFLPCVAVASSIKFCAKLTEKVRAKVAGKICSTTPAGKASWRLLSLPSTKSLMKSGILNAAPSDTNTDTQPANTQTLMVSSPLHCWCCRTDSITTGCNSQVNHEPMIQSQLGQTAGHQNILYLDTEL